MSKTIETLRETLQALSWDAPLPLRRRIIRNARKAARQHHCSPATMVRRAIGKILGNAVDVRQNVK